MKALVIFLLIAIAALPAGCALPPGAAQPPEQAAVAADGGLPVSTPEEQGMDSAQLAEFFEWAARLKPDLYSALVMRNGAIVAEAYAKPTNAATRREVYSVTKSFTSALIGIAIERGKIEGVEQRVLDFFPGQTYENLDAGKEAMTLENVLTMTAGLEWVEGDPAYQAMWQSRDWLTYMLDKPMTAEPGTRFNYCSGCSHILTRIVAETTGAKGSAFARENLLEPIGIVEAEWEEDSRGIPIGGWGLQLTTRELARFGLLYLNGGEWNGKQVVPRAWVEASVQPRMPTDGNLKYGYQWWINPDLEGFAALGRDGQMIFVQPEEKLVVVFTARSVSHDAEFNLIEQFVLPAAQGSAPLPDNPEGQALLREKIDAMAE